MSNIFGIFIGCSLIVYLFNRFVLWVSGAMLKKITLKKRTIWVHAIEAVIVVCLLLWGVLFGNPVSVERVSEIIIVLLALMFISYFAITYEAKLKSGPFGSAPQSDAPVGMGGFLSFFTFMISVFAPLSQLGRISSVIRESEEKLPFLKDSIDWSNLVSITWMLAGIYIVAYCYAGIILRSDFRKETIDKVVAIMWACGPVLSIAMNSVNNYYYNKIDPDIIASDGFNGQLIGTIILAALWTAYLVRSKRVQNTYP